MEKWKLLKSAISKIGTGSNNSIPSEDSIHRFQGFRLIESETRIQRGFRFQASFTDNDYVVFENFLGNSLNLLRELDVAHLIYDVTFKDSAVTNTLRSVIMNHSNCCNILGDTNKNTIVLEIFDINYQPLFNPRNTMYLTHTLPISVFMDPNIADGFTVDPVTTTSVITRERVLSGSVTIQELLSNRLHGVDNTGNICVWPSESILLHTLLTVDKYRSLVAGRRVLELGGGMTALCGLGLAVSGLCPDVVLTDGHPDCVRNQKCCIALNQHFNGITSGVNLHSRLLRWSEMDEQGQLAKLLLDTITVGNMDSTGIHTALLAVLRMALSPANIDTSKRRNAVVLLQPARSGSMSLFLSRAKHWFDCLVIENYNPLMTFLRHEYRSGPGTIVTSTGRPKFDEDLHYPILLVLTLK